MAVLQNHLIKKRVPYIFAFILLCFLALAVRLLWVQVVRGTHYSDLAMSTRTKGVKVEAKRGDILDRNGKVLAVSINTDSVYAIPGEIKNPEETAEKLAGILNISQGDVLRRITLQQFHVYIAHKVTPEQSEKISEADLSGIGLEGRNQRFYPMDNRASHVVGFAGTDNQGLYGIEVAYEDYLRGEDGRLAAEFDNRGREIPGGMRTFSPPEAGHTIKLTLDETIQYIVERELSQAVEKYQVKRGTAIVMDTKSGEILAMANYPDFNPNDPFSTSAEQWRNPAVSDTYEPGSTFKIVTLAAALSEKEVDFNETFDCQGRIEIPGASIRCIRNHGPQTVLQGIENSCNVVFVNLGLRLGVDRLYEYMQAFSFGEKTGIDFPGEANGILIPLENTKRVDLARISFGQAFTATPLQMVAATSAIANDGIYQTPRLVKEVIDSDNGEVVEVHDADSAGSRVISTKTAGRLQAMLESAVENGTGRNAYIDGYRIAGKTGTAQKIIDGSYASGKFVASFLGFAPADQPSIAVIVVMDEPSGSLYQGGQVAAPVFQAVVRDTLQYLGKLPSFDENDTEVKEEKEKVVVPGTINLSREDAEKKIKAAGLELRWQGRGDVVKKQFPAEGEVVQEGNLVTLYMPGSLDEKIIVPDVRGLNIRMSAEILEMYGLKMSPEGSGSAKEQSPKPGAEVEAGATVEILFE